MKLAVPLVLSLAFGMSACALAPIDPNVEIAQPKEYETGSRLPKRGSDKKVAKLTKEELEQLERDLSNSANAHGRQ